METFIAEYTVQLTLAVQNYPEEYVYPVSEVPVVIQRMKAAILAKSYNKDSRAFKETCKKLKIPHTYKAIDHFIANHV